MKDEQPLMLRIEKIYDEAEDKKSFFFRHKMDSKPGQFVMLWVPEVNEKPYGISFQDDETFAITVCKVGPFTEKLFDKKIGDFLGIRGPYGIGFTIKPCNRAVLIGGGFGVAPLAFLAEELSKLGTKIIFITGAKNKQCLLYSDRFKETHIKTLCATDDGSFGEKGFVTDVLSNILKKDEVNMIYTCGPEKMMQKVIEISDEHNISCELSLERYMKCGIGICGSCCMDPSGARVCEDGPVFSKESVRNLTEFGRYKRDASGKTVVLE